MPKSLIAVFMCKKSRYGETLNKDTHPKTCTNLTLIILFFQDSLHKGVAQLFCTRQVIFWTEKVKKLPENYKRYEVSLQRGSDINCIKSGKIIKLFSKT